MGSYLSHWNPLYLYSIIVLHTFGPSSDSSTEDFATEVLFALTYHLNCERRMAGQFNPFDFMILIVLGEEWRM